MSDAKIIADRMRDTYKVTGDRWFNLAAEEIDRTIAKIESDAKVIAALREALKDCADDLAEEVEARYIGFKEHPAMTPKYYRDMASVYAARDLLAANEQNVGERS